jgi:hypothetical protein
MCWTETGADIGFFNLAAVVPGDADTQMINTGHSIANAPVNIAAVAVRNILEARLARFGPARIALTRSPRKDVPPAKSMPSGGRSASICMRAKVVRHWA